MRMANSGSVCLFKDALPPGITAGFTLPEIAGRKLSSDEIQAVLRPFIRDVSTISWCTQPHEENISIVEAPGVFPTDGLLTDREHSLLVIRTADCMPLYVYAPDKNYVGVLHLGWKSINKGILKTLEVFLKDEGLTHFTCIAGPGLRKCCYEVKEDFLSTNLEPFVQKKGNQYFFDPIACIQAQCTSMNIPLTFYDSDLCTLCGKEHFHSYRRDKTDKRILSFICNTGE